MRIIGLTGGIGAGKSTVSNHLIEKGYTVLDADKISREVVLPGEPALLALLDTFGSEILQEDGSLDRKAMGKLVFSDSEKRIAAEKILHGEIIRRIFRSIAEIAEGCGREAVFVDAPLIFETDLANQMDEVWLVDAPEDTRLLRVIDRDGSSREEILRRMDSQMPSAEKRLRASVIIDNDGSEEELCRKIDALLNTISERDHA